MEINGSKQQLLMTSFRLSNAREMHPLRAQPTSQNDQQFDQHIIQRDAYYQHQA